VSLKDIIRHPILTGQAKLIENRSERRSGLLRTAELLACS
jgi:hypothetical protein